MSTSTRPLRTIGAPVPFEPAARRHRASRAGASSARASRAPRVLRLVAERADAEAKVEAERTSSDATADTEYDKTRQALIEKLQRLEREANADDEKRRRAIIDAALDGEAKAKAEFAAASRKIATLFDSARDAAKSEYNRAKNEAAAAFDSGQKKAAREHAEKTKPIDDSAAHGRRFRERLAFLAADYASSSSTPSPRSRPASRTTNIAIPATSCSRGWPGWRPPLKLLEGLIIPKSMKGAGEAWVFILVILPLLVWLRGRIGDAQIGDDRRGRRGRRRARVPAAHLAGQALASPSSNAFTPRSCSRWPTPTA